MKLNIVIIAVLGILFCAPVMAQVGSLELKYWLHSSCKKYPLGEGKKYNLRKALDEMFRMARLASRRMDSMRNNNSPRDIEFRRLWKMVFKTDYDDTNRVMYPMEYLKFFAIPETDSLELPFTIAFSECQIRPS